MRYDGNALGFGASGGEDGIAVNRLMELVCLAKCMSENNDRVSKRCSHVCGQCL